jgi:hypothetical protein
MEYDTVLIGKYLLNFGGDICFNFQGSKTLNLKMQGAHYCKNSVTICQSARRHIPEDESSLTTT